MAVEIATPDEIKTFATPKPNEELIAKIVATWEKIMDPVALYYLPMEKEVDENDEVSGRLYMEGTRETQPWIAGVIPAFASFEELTQYVEWMCMKRDQDPRDYSAWVASFRLIHETMPVLNRQWRESGGEGNLRVELHFVEKDGNIQFGDILWDCSTV